MRPACRRASNLIGSARGRLGWAASGASGWRTGAEAQPTVSYCVGYVYNALMHTVCELQSFQRAATDVGMTETEVRGLIDHLASHPMAGDVMQGTGGCRKLRWAGRGKGKSGGYRTVTFYSGRELPVFLVTVFSKGERTNLSDAERNALAAMTKAIVVEYRERVVKVSGAG